MCMYRGSTNFYPTNHEHIRVLLKRSMLTCISSFFSSQYFIFWYGTHPYLADDCMIDGLLERPRLNKFITPSTATPIISDIYTMDNDIPIILYFLQHFKIYQI